MKADYEAILAAWVALGAAQDEITKLKNNMPTANIPASTDALQEQLSLVRSLMFERLGDSVADSLPFFPG